MKMKTFEILFQNAVTPVRLRANGLAEATREARRVVGTPDTPVKTWRIVPARRKQP